MYGVGSANFNGAIMNFDYTGSVQTATLTPGRYKLECWGAEGGNGTDSPNTNGKGGYSVGVLTLSVTLYIFIFSLFVLFYIIMFLGCLAVLIGLGGPATGPRVHDKG